MPGAYAHITLISLMLDKREMRALPKFDRRAEKAVRLFNEYAVMGCMSPDFPYLAITDLGSSRWADLMHENSGAMLRHGVDLVKQYDGEDRQKGLAWLLGYASHVGGDLTIHPVLSENNFEYKANPGGHRTCEMHQDVFIFPRLSLGGVGLPGYMPGVVGACCDPDDEDEIDPIIEQLWDQMLSKSFPDDYRDDKPNIDAWFSQFRTLVAAIAKMGHGFFDWGRQIAADNGLIYPAPNQVNRQKYISALKTPTGGVEHYDDLFEKARRNAFGIWETISEGVYNPGAGPHHTKIKDWNLDTGKDNGANGGALVFW